MDLSKYVSLNSVLLLLAVVALAVAVWTYIQRRNLALHVALAKRTLDAASTSMPPPSNKLPLADKKKLILEQLQFTFDHMQQQTLPSSTNDIEEENYYPMQSPQQHALLHSPAQQNLVPLPDYTTANTPFQSSPPTPTNNSNNQDPTTTDLHSLNTGTGFRTGAARHPDAGIGAFTPMPSSPTTTTTDTNNTALSPSMQRNTELIAPPANMQRELPPELQPISCGRGSKR